MNADGLMSMLFDTMATQGKMLLPDDDTELLKRALNDHTPVEGGELRIYVAVKIWGRDLKRLAQFVKDEYYIGGYSWEQDYFVDYDGRGFRIWKRGEDHKYSWEKVARTLVEMHERSQLYDLSVMQKAYAVYMRCTGYPDPAPRMSYPPEVKKKCT